MDKSLRSPPPGPFPGLHGACKLFSSRVRIGGVGRTDKGVTEMRQQCLLGPDLEVAQRAAAQVYIDQAWFGAGGGEGRGYRL